MRSCIPITAALLAVLAILALTVSSTPRTPSAAAAGDCTADGTLDAEEKVFLVLINNHRTQNGLLPLGVSYTLSKAAQWKSQDMGANSYFAHDDLNRTWVQRIRDCGYGYNTSLGENIAAGIASAQSAFTLWKNSSGHNANMLNGNYRTIGIGRGYTAGSPYGWYWTTEFGGVDDGYVTISGSPASQSGDTEHHGARLVISRQRDGSYVARLVGKDLSSIVRVDFAANSIVFAKDARAPYYANWRGSRGVFTATLYDATGRAETLRSDR